MPEYKQLGPYKQKEQTEAPFHVSALPDGSPWIEFYRTSEGYLLRFPSFADFDVSVDGRRVASRACPGIGEATVEHLYLNQVLPLALSKSGQFVFHASAVEIGKGAVVFLGAAGRGKSTLAAAFATKGYRFLTDDGLVLEPAGEEFLVLPSHASIRLWQDSHTHLLPIGIEVAPPVSYTSKSRLLVGNSLSFCDEPRTLLAAYSLGSGTSGHVQMEPLPGSGALIEWAQHAFILDTEDRVLLAAHFDRLACLATSTPSFALDYPRKFDDLDHVIKSIVSHSQSLERP